MLKLNDYEKKDNTILLKTQIKKIPVIVYLFLLFFVLIWNALIILAPCLASIGGIWSDASILLYKFFSPYCHQEDSRSFHVFGYKFGVCSRCTLIYLGFLAGSIIFPLVRGFKKKDMPPIWLLLIPVFLLFTDFLFDILDILRNSFTTRSITGFLVGAVLPFYIIPGTIIFVEEVNAFIKNYKNAGKSK
jgi:uncharacterized membrane protein